MSAKTSPDLKAFLDAKKKPTYLLGPVERHLLSRTTPSTRRTDVLHPSEMCSDWCIRASWFLLNGAEKHTEVIPLRLANIFAEGHAIHAKWQAWLAEMDVLRGGWYCRTDDVRWWGLRSDHKPSSLCQVEYDEVPIIDEQYRISGQADGWLTGLNGPEAILEIKSIGTGTLRTGGVPIDKGGLAASFRSLNRPLTNHVRQATIYLWVLKRMYEQGKISDLPPNQLLFLYECKEDQSAREYKVQYNEEYIETVLEKLAILDPDSAQPPACTGEKQSGGRCKKCEPYESI